MFSCAISLVFQGQYLTKKNVANLPEKSTLRIVCGVHPCLYKNRVNLLKAYPTKTKTCDCGVLIFWCCSFCPPTLKCFLRIITPPKFGSSPLKKRWDWKTSASPLKGCQPIFRDYVKHEFSYKSATSISNKTTAPKLNITRCFKKKLQRFILLD